MMELLHRLGWAIAGASTLALAAVLAGLVDAGSLDPPGGAPGGTDGVRLPGTPISSLPVTLSQPGNYYLTRNLSFSTTGTAIDVTSENVTVDLNGFVLEGAGFGTGIDSQADGTTVRNGTVRDWGVGVSLAGNWATLVESVHAISNFEGVSVGGGVVRDCVLVGNDTGLNATGASVTGCVAAANGTGMTLFDSVITDSVARSNSGDGIWAQRSMIQRCAAVLNGDDGFDVQSSLVTDSSAATNANDGIAVSDTGSLIARNALHRNGAASGGSGIYVSGSNNRIEENHATDNGGVNIFQDVGISVGGSGNTVVRNSARGNTLNYSLGGNDAGPIDDAATASSPWANIASP